MEPRSKKLYIRNTSVKSATVGLHIKYGANSGSSDSDIFGLNITGTGERDSIGILIEGYDNTLTNVRIGNVFVGVDIVGGGNILKNIHPLYYITSPSYEFYDDSVGFKNDRTNWFENCYSDQFATGFYTTHGGVWRDCYAYWYSEKETKHVAISSANAFDGKISNMTAGSHYPDKSHAVFTDMSISDNASIDDIYVLGRRIKDV